MVAQLVEVIFRHVPVKKPEIVLRQLTREGALSYRLSVVYMEESGPCEIGEIKFDLSPDDFKERIGPATMADRIARSSFPGLTVYSISYDPIYDFHELNRYSRVMEISPETAKDHLDRIYLAKEEAARMGKG